MARQPSITQEQVNAAASELRAAGVTPTHRKVREALGNKGSNDTILRMLAVYHEAEPMPQSKPVVALPAELESALRVALSQAQSEVQVAYEGQLLVARADRASAIGELAAHHERYETMKAALAEKTSDWDRALTRCDELEKDVKALKDREEEREALREKAEKAAAAAEAKVAMLEQKVQEQEAAAKAATEAHGKALAELQSAHADALAKLQAEGKHAAEKAAAELAQSAQALTKAQAEGAGLGKELEAAKGRISGLQGEVSKAQAAQKAAEDKTTAQALELSKAQGRIEVLQEQAKKAETLQQRVFELQAKLPPAEAPKTAQKPAKR